MENNISVKMIANTAIGISLYVIMAMSMRIPLIGHISVDLGYIVLGVYAYIFGSLTGAMVGGIGAAIISTLTGWFSPSWTLGNILIGFITGRFYKKSGEHSFIINIVITVIAVMIGILITKTIVECTLYDIPYLVKIPKNFVAFVTDSIVMCCGINLASHVNKRLMIA